MHTTNLHHFDSAPARFMQVHLQKPLIFLQKKRFPVSLLRSLNRCIDSFSWENLNAETLQLSGSKKNNHENSWIWIRNNKAHTFYNTQTCLQCGRYLVLGACWGCVSLIFGLMKHCIGSDISLIGGVHGLVVVGNPKAVSSASASTFGETLDSNWEHIGPYRACGEGVVMAMGIYSLQRWCKEKSPFWVSAWSIARCEESDTVHH